MGEDTRYADLAARLLRERPPAPPSHTSRDEGISAVAQALALRKRRRTTRAALGAAAFAVAAGGALMLFWPASGERLVAAGACSGAPCPSARGLTLGIARGSGQNALAVGKSFVAPPDSPASVVLPTGTRITLDEGGALERREDTSTQRFAVLRGSARWQVAKLHAGERFLVETPSAEIEVRGTVFSVHIDEPAAGCPSRTSVDVEEGAVVVRFTGGELLLHGGDHWASACPAAAAAVVAHGAPSRAPAPAPKLVGTSVHGVTAAVQVAPAQVTSAAPPSVALPVSMLTEQNDLYARAQLAQREGRPLEALSAYARLLELFPRGALAETAFVQRVRLLERSDPARARVEARLYVDRFPAGFGTAEMQRLLRAP